MIFLDIDGVLNQHLPYDSVPKPKRFIDPDCVGHLNRIIESTSHKVVIISQWRAMVHNGLMTVGGFRQMLLTHGVTEFLCIADMGQPATEGWFHHSPMDRVMQMTAYHRKNPPAEPWCVIDDLEMGFGKDQWRHVRPDPAVGLTTELADRAIGILLGKING